MVNPGDDKPRLRGRRGSCVSAAFGNGWLPSSRRSRYLPWQDAQAAWSAGTAVFKVSSSFLPAAAAICCAACSASSVHFAASGRGVAFQNADACVKPFTSVVASVAASVMLGVAPPSAWRSAVKPGPISFIASFRFSSSGDIGGGGFFARSVIASLMTDVAIIAGRP